MDSKRRNLLKVTAASVCTAPLMVQQSLAQVVDADLAERVLYRPRDYPAVARWKSA